MVQSADRMQFIHSDIRGPLYQEALRMQKQGIPILKMNTGNPAAFDFTMPPSVRSALETRMSEAVPYCESQGMQDARAAILAYHKSKGLKHITEDDIFIGNGVSEMAQMALLALLNPGDEILVPCPNYSLWSNSARLADAVPVPYVCDEQSDWFPDVKDIENKITPRTRAMVIINPNNPTGAVYSKVCLESILQIAREHRLLVFSDEIYDRLLLDGAEHHSAAALAPDVPVVTLNGLSKSHIICGFRCGWMVLNAPDAALASLRASLEALSSMRLCGNALTQLVIPAALNDFESTKAMMVPGGALYERRKAVFETLSQADGVSFVPNHAAFYLFPRFDHRRFHIEDDREFCMDLLKEKHVLVVPGSGFGYPEPNHFRIVMLPEVEVLREAVTDILSQLLSRE